MLEILQHFGIDEIRPDVSKRQVQISCPLAKWTHEFGADNKPSMGINFGSSPPYCHCFACGYRGNIYNLLYKYGSYSENPEIKALSKTLRHENRFEDMKAALAPKWEAEEEAQIFLLDSVLNNFPPVEDYKRALSYLESRDVALPIQKVFDLRYDPNRDAIVMPVRERDGKLIGAVGRLLDPQEAPKYYNYLGIKTQRALGGFHLLGESKRILVVEGPFCLLRGYGWKFLLDYEILCTFGAKMSLWQAEQISSIADCTVLCYDSDVAGTQARDNAIKLLTVPSVRAVTFPKGQDIGSLDYGTFKDLFSNAQKELVNV